VGRPPKEEGKSNICEHQTDREVENKSRGGDPKTDRNRARAAGGMRCLVARSPHAVGALLSAGDPLVRGPAAHGHRRGLRGRGHRLIGSGRWGGLRWRRWGRLWTQGARACLGNFRGIMKSDLAWMCLRLWLTGGNASFDCLQIHLKKTCFGDTQSRKVFKSALKLNTG